MVIKLNSWVQSIGYQGIRKVRKKPGFHDEPLRGKRKSQRSIRLSKAYRAFYYIEKQGNQEKIVIIEVNKHDY